MADPREPRNPEPLIGPLYLRAKTTDSYTFHQVFEQEQYRPAIGLHDYKVIFDLGANIGLSMLYFQQHYPHAQIIAVEPHQGNLDLLHANLRSLKKRDTLYWYHAAIGGSEGFGSIVDRGLGHSTYQVKPDIKGVLEIKTMEKLLSMYPQRPNLVKMDIEGAEVACFQHPAWLEQVDVLAVELHGETAEKALDDALWNSKRQFRRWTLGQETTFVEFM